MRKPKYLKSQVVRITYTPDYRHEAWMGAGDVPTPSTCPDAFDAHREPAYPKPIRPSTRRKPRAALSRTALRKRLYQAGVRGTKVKGIATEILTGPGALEGPIGKIALGWNVTNFTQKFGPRVARAVLQGISVYYFFQDEYCFYSAPIADAFARARSDLVAIQGTPS